MGASWWPALGLASAGSSSQRSVVDGVVSRVPSPRCLGGAHAVSLLPAGTLCTTHNYSTAAVLIFILVFVTHVQTTNAAV